MGFFTCITANDTNSSIGLKYLENKVEKLKTFEKTNVEEIYTKDISGGWIGAIYNVTFENQGKKHSSRAKLFYNNSFVVEEIYNVNGEPFSRFLKMPLVSKELAYSKDALIFSSNDKEKQESAKNLVIFSDLKCIHCKLKLPKILASASEKNMNIYLHNFAFGEEDIFLTILMLYTFDKYPSKKLEIAKKTHEYDFPLSKNKYTVLKLFNILHSTDIKIEDIDFKAYESKIEKSNELIDTLYIDGTPTVYLDGVQIETNN